VRAVLSHTLAPEADALIFGTSRGAPQTATNIRHRVLGRSIKRANEDLAKQRRFGRFVEWSQPGSNR
jgi:hypothetical protein